MVKSTAGKTNEATFEFTTNEDEAPSAFELEVTINSKSEANISWTAATLTTGDNVIYDLFLEDLTLDRETVINDVTDLTYNFSQLFYTSEYNIRVVAKSPTGKSTQAEANFQTFGTPPSEFTLTYEEINPGYLVLNWEHPTVEDGSGFGYELYLDNELYTSFGSQGDDSIALIDLEEGREYRARLVAIGYNNTETEASLTFTTRIYPHPSAFEITIHQISEKEVFVDYTDSTMDDGTQVIYFLYINDERYNRGFYYGPGGIRVDGLEPDNDYVFRIEAEEVAFRQRTSAEGSLTIPPVHPTLTVDEAVLYLRGSAFFEEQVNVGFSGNIESYDIFEFHLGLDIDIPSFLLYPSAISSPRLSNEDYGFYQEQPTGFVKLRDAGIEYMIPFDVTTATN